MTVTEFRLKVIRRIPILRRLYINFIRKCLINPEKRKTFNNHYLSLGYKEREILHGLLAKLFINEEVPININDIWKVKFLDKIIRLPMESEQMWAHWHTAVSIVGTDLEVKNFYERLITSKYRPEYFFDIGANYGTHSLLFLSQDIKVISFEPNPVCHSSFDKLVKLNNVEHNLEPFAIGDQDNEMVLTFPQAEIGLGSLTTTNLLGFTDANDLEKIKVRVLRLDTYLKDKLYWPDFIKIDTEGFELNVLKGAKNTMCTRNLIIIFESIKKDQRDLIFNYLYKIGYNIFDLLNLSAGCLSKSDYINSQNINFITINKKHPIISDLYQFEIN